MARERILITVKTYPTLSATYGELVCTAGLREDGSWIRIYPIPFRRLEDFQKFEKYRIVEADVTRNWKDSRPESHRVDFQSLQLTDEILPMEFNGHPSFSGCGKGSRMLPLLCQEALFDELGIERALPILNAAQSEVNLWLVAKSIPGSSEF